MKTVPKIVSGGQTGADRAALDWALAHGVEGGGWCPKGRKAEDGPIDPKYPLKETPSSAYLQRTEWNVRDSDATVLFSIDPTLTGGSKKTVEFARKHNKPWLHLCAAEKVVDGETEGFRGRARCEGAERRRSAGEQRTWGRSVRDNGCGQGFRQLSWLC
jgi:hypothetical protein